MLDLKALTDTILEEGKMQLKLMGTNDEFMTVLYFINKEGKIYSRILAPFDNRDTREEVRMVARAKARVEDAIGIFAVCDVWSLDISQAAKIEGVKLKEKGDAERFHNELKERYGNTLDNYPRELITEKLSINATLLGMGHHVTLVQYKRGDSGAIDFEEPVTLHQNSDDGSSLTSDMSFGDWSTLSYDYCKKLMTLFEILNAANQANKPTTIN